ncbi:MAG: hypothetical protein KatS3mg008_1689 [Acidimicrobiales bacterium]|nr:MAG: hypothetical protein KatS3mg008_1689 [Acidimicrobiales bacterium]
MTPARLLKAVRVRNGLSQQELASRAGVSQPVISVYERGRRDPTVGTLARLIAACGERLSLDARPDEGTSRRASAVIDEREHARLLLDALSLADAIHRKGRVATLEAPRIVSERPDSPAGRSPERGSSREQRHSRVRRVTRTRG